MKKFFCLIILSLLAGMSVKAQLLDYSPNFPTETGSVTITFDAAKGSSGLKDCGCDVYLHTGVITDKSTGPSDWKYVKHPWATTFADIKMTALGNNKHQITISNPRTYYNVPAGEKILKIAMVFRNGDGSKEGKNSDNSDIYLPITEANAFAIRITNPAMQPKFVPVTETIAKNIGDPIAVTAYTSKSSTINLLLNNTSFANGSAITVLSGQANITSSGLQEIKVTANDGATTTETGFSFLVSGSVQIADLPAGVKEGVNFLNNGTSAIFNLYAPGKNNIYVIGDFNNWQGNNSSFMKKTPDGKNWWVQIDNLDPNVEYAYQYLVDGNLKIADPYTHKVLDPFNDKFIDAATYPALKPYPTDKTTGIVSTFSAKSTSYNWNVTNFQRPKKTDLVIYELLVRDFVEKHNYQTLIDTISYLKNLGVNAVELMPVQEFEGNESWGYNTSFHLATDKYYGTENKLKQFIDLCHQNGIAVILDMVLNHAFGQNPMVQLYWDSANSRPASNSPWFNAIPTHPFNVGYDFNHESVATKNYVKNVCDYWQSDFKIDGFRFDLSKGFTQKNNLNNVGAWSAYDASRIAIWKDYFNHLTKSDPEFYVILEHFADNAEEKELSDYGMMLWGNINHNYNEATMGYLSSSNLSSALHTSRNFIKPNLVSYMESHDEERLMYKNLQFGNVNGTYSTKDLNTALKRMEMAAAFFFPLPGPKMIWQFGERGYDLSINYPSNTSNDRLSNKPPLWNYMSNTNRKQLYDVYSKLIKLRISQPVFETTDFTTNLAGAVKTIYLNDPALKVVVVGNFDVQNQSATLTFPNTGKWYNYLTKDSIVVNNVNHSMNLTAGEYYLFTSRNLNTTGGTTPIFKEMKSEKLAFKNYPNPISNSTTFVYQVESNSNVSLKVYNLIGKEIITLINEKQNKGEHKWTWELNKTGSTLEEGIYFAKLKIGEREQTIKLVITK